MGASELMLYSLSAPQRQVFNVTLINRHHRQVWIGGHDQEVEGQWEMITTGEKVTWKNFERGQPDNWKGRSITHEKGIITA